MYCSYPTDGSGLGRKPKTKPAPVKQEFNTMTTFS